MTFIDFANIALQHSKLAHLQAKVVRLPIHPYQMLSTTVPPVVCFLQNLGILHPP